MKNNIFNELKRKPSEEKSFEGFLMNKDIVVAKIQDNNIETINYDLLPSYIKVGGAFENWLNSRCIDTSRPNSRKLRKTLSLKTSNLKDIVINFNAFNMMDNYWIKTEKDTITFNELINPTDELYKTAIDGILDDYKLDKNSRSPEFTNIGSFEKCWKKINNEWYLIKKGSKEENFSELLASRLGEYFGFDIVHYDLYENKQNYVMCKNFIENREYNFEPMSIFVDDDEDFDLSLDYIQKLNITQKDFFHILFLDSLIFNSDRHTNNYGILTHEQTGEPIKMAPNFDNNLALLAYSGLSTVNSNIRLSEMIRDFLMEQNYIIPTLKEEDLYTIISETYDLFGDMYKTKEFVFEFIKSRYNLYK